MESPSVLSLLRERAGLQPDDTAFSFTDYEQDWAGVNETLTWGQLYQRTLNVAHEVRRHGSVGDRAVILAPQGLAYIVGFLGAMHAGFIAVPLSVPQAGSHDERVSAVLADTSPSVILTTSGRPGLPKPLPSTLANWARRLSRSMGWSWTPRIRRVSGSAMPPARPTCNTPRARRGFRPE